MTHIKYHQLIKPVYSFPQGKRVLTGMKLTLEGKRAIGRVGTDLDEQIAVPQQILVQDEKKMDIPSVMKIIAKLKEDNPEFEINFDVRLKRDSANSLG